MKNPQSVEKFRWFKENFRAYLVKKRVEKFLREIEESSLDDEWEKFISGRISYGGEFAPENIDSVREKKDEVLDFNNYSDNEEFVQYRFDPVGFTEFVCQYMQ